MDKLGMILGGGVMGDMVVPTPAELLDEFALETSVAGLSDPILNPSIINQVDSLCTIGVAGDYSIHEPTNLSQLFSDGYDYSSVFSTDIGDYIGDHQPFNTGPIGDYQEMDNTAWGNGRKDEIPQEGQFSELTWTGSADWLTENADLAMIERMATENEQQCQLLSDLLAQSDDVFQEQLETSDDYEEMSQSEEDDETVDEEKAESDEILDGLYREARQLFERDTLVHQGRTGRFQRSVAPKIPKTSPPPFLHLADHDFFVKRDRSVGKSMKKQSKVKREASLKSKKRLQNREAALRYRLKKRAEKMEKESEIEQLAKRNQRLKNEKYSLTAEVGYLKELLIEIRKLKG